MSTYNPKYYAKNAERIKAANKSWRDKNKEKVKKQIKLWQSQNKERKNLSTVFNRRKRNGFSKELFNKLLLEQNNKCAICETEIKSNNGMDTICADHNHIDNTPRGLLCKRCNILLGHSKDDIELLKKAITYLENYMFKRTA